MNKSCIRLSALATLIIMLAGMVTSCSNKTDISDLLATVPGDASAVAAIDIHSVVEKAGCKIDGSKIVPGKEVESLISAQGGSDASKIRDVLNGKTGIDPSAILFFIEGTDQYITGFLAEPAQFKEYVKKSFSEEWETLSGVDRCGNIAVKGNQFWMRTSHRNDIDPVEVGRFADLSEKLSILSSPQAERLSKMDHDIMGWGNISSLYSASEMSFQEKTMAGLAMAIFFSDAQDMAFDADFENGRFVSSLSVLNSKGAPAKFNLPVERIDLSMLKSLTPSADAFIALAISPKLVEQLKKEAGGKSIPGAEQVFEALAALDGTCVIAGNQNNFTGVVSTDGKSVNVLSDLIGNSFGVPVNIDGKLLKFGRGQVSGPLTSDDAASLFKGAMIGVAVSGDGLGKQIAKGVTLKSLCAAMVPVDGSMQFNMEVQSTNEKENILLTFIKEAK